MIRPSNLPKLNACAQFESDPGTSAAAERGTRIDAMFRDLVTSPNGIRTLQDEEEWAVAKWAADYVRNRCGLESAGTDSNACWVSTNIQGLEIVGTMDAVCWEMNLLFDLKTGQIRDYYEQMAAYALACMERHGEDHWTAILIFADQREIREHRFSRTGARYTVNDIVHARTVETPTATPCDYCSWCAKRTSCEALHASANKALGLVSAPERLQGILTDPDKLGSFLESASVVSMWIEQAREAAKAIIAGGGSVPGWSLQDRKGRTSVSTEKLVQAGADVSKLLPGTVSEKTARAALPSLPDSLIERGENTVALVQQKKK